MKKVLITKLILLASKICVKKVVENVCINFRVYRVAPIPVILFLLVRILQSNQVKRTPQEYINEFIIQKLNPLLVVNFRLISAFLHV